MTYYIEKVGNVYDYYAIKIKGNKRKSKFLYLLDFDSRSGYSLWISEKRISNLRQVYNFVSSDDIEGSLVIIRSGEHQIYSPIEGYEIYR